MNTRTLSGHRTVFLLMFAVLGLTSFGCKSTPRIDWNTRVGVYTYDQAIEELGPPDKSAPLSDGTIVADWIKHNSGGGLSFGVGTGFVGNNSAVGVGAGTSTGYHDKVLRLIFAPDHKLVSWSKNY